MGRKRASSSKPTTRKRSQSKKALVKGANLKPKTRKRASSAKPKTRKRSQSKKASSEPKTRKRASSTKKAPKSAMRKVKRGKVTKAKAKAELKKPLMKSLFQSSLPVKMKMPPSPSPSTSTSKTKAENQEDVQTIVTLKRDTENEDHFEIDLDTIIDPHTGKSMEVHAVADVDKDTMEVHGEAEAEEGHGTAKIEGALTHGGRHDEDAFMLDVLDTSTDSDDMTLEADTSKKTSN